MSDDRITVDDGRDDGGVEGGPGEVDRRRDRIAIVGVLLLSLVGVVALIVLIGDDPLRPIPDDALDRTWVAVERSERPPRAVAPVYVATAGERGVVLTGSDGCSPVEIEIVGTGGVIDEVDPGDEPARPCPEGGTPFTWRPGDEIVAGPDELDIVREGTVIARFVALDSLTPAETDDLGGAWMIDRGRGLASTPTPIDVQLDLGVLCLGGPGRRPTWSADDGRLVVDGLGSEDCEVIEGFDVNRDIERFLLEPTRVWHIGDALLFTHPDAALLIRPWPVGSPDPSGIDVASGTAFGIRPGVGVATDDVLDAVGDVLGDPTFDSGWVDLPSRGWAPCGGTEDFYRMLWWGDLSFAFWRTGARTFLEDWTIGDLPFWRIVPGVDAAIAPGAVDPSGLRTEIGLTVGDPPDRLDGLDVGYTEFAGDNAGYYAVGSPAGGGAYVVRDGRIVTITSGPGTC